MAEPTTETKTDDKVKEIAPKGDEKEKTKTEPKTETRASRIVALFQAEVKNLSDRITALEGSAPTETLEEEIKREERREEGENLFDEVGRRIHEILGTGA